MRTTPRSYASATDVPAMLLRRQVTVSDGQSRSGYDGSEPAFAGGRRHRCTPDRRQHALAHRLPVGLGSGLPSGARTSLAASAQLRERRPQCASNVRPQIRERLASISRVLCAKPRLRDASAGEIAFTSRKRVPSGARSRAALSGAGGAPPSCQRTVFSPTCCGYAAPRQSCHPKRRRRSSPRGNRRPHDHPSTRERHRANAAAASRDIIQTYSGHS